MDSRWKPNVTVAAIIEREGRFLLVEERTSEGLKLNNPAGHLELGESLADACKREAVEETAHGFTPTALIGIYMTRRARGTKNDDVTYLRFAFCGDLGDQVPGAELDEGIVGTLWMDIHELRASQARHRSPLILRSIEDYLAGQRLALPVIYTDPSVFR
jgi:8-oxo-dGTP pyrophosphatase MutT (NUDIX family)